MKKILAIVCAMAVFVSVLAGTFVFSGANTTDEEYPTALVGTLSEMVDGGGSYSSSFALIDSLTSLNSKQSVSVTPVANYISNGADASSNKVVVYNYSEAFAMKDVEGYMFYVDVSANTTKNVNFLIKNHTALNAGAGGNAGVFGWASLAKAAGETPTVYLLADDDEEGTNWTTQALPTDRSDLTANPYASSDANSGINLPIGFKGYVYIPTDCYHVNTISIQSIAVFMCAPVSLPDAKYYVSAPMFVSGFSVDAKTFVGDDATVNLDTNKVFVEEALPSYDYSDYKIMNATVLKPSADITVGGDNSVFRVTSGSTVSVIDSLLGAFDYPSIKLTRGDTDGEVQLAYYTIGNVDNTKGKGATALMLYVELPEGKTATIASSLNFMKDDGTGGRYNTNSYNASFQLLAEGSDTWTTVKATNSYNAALPAGFKGLVRYDYAQLGGPDATSRLFDAYFIFRNVAANTEIKVSLPLLIEEYTDEYEDWYVFADGNTKSANHLLTNEVLVPSEGGEEPGPGGEGGGETPDPGPGTGGEGGETPTRPTEEPDYDLPKYDGEAIDYKYWGLSKVWIAKLNAMVFKDFDFDSNAAVINRADYKVIDSITKISNYPSVEMTSNGTGAIELIYYPKADYATGATSILYYVELEDGKDAGVSFRTLFPKADGSSGVFVGHNFDEPVYYMAEGTREWVKVDTGMDYYADLPAGFKGYIRLDYSIYGNDYNATSRLTQGWLIFNGVENGDKIKASAPILIDEISSFKVPAVAYIGNDMGAGRDIFTGEFVLPGDEALGGKTVEPDYKIPAHSTKVEYGELDIMHVRTAKLKGSIIVGNPLSTDIYVPGFGNGSATNSLVGISNYPMFKVTDADVPVGIAKNTVFTANYDYSQNIGASSIMFYVKLPADSDADFAMSTSWRHKDGKNSTGAYNYSGIFYTMAKGETKWSYKTINKYWHTLPKGFEGYIRIDLKDINAVYAFDEQGRVAYLRDEKDELILDANNKPIKDPDANYYHLNGDWGIETVYAAFSRDSEDQLVNAIISSPILIDEFIPLQTIQNIAYVDGDTNAARDIFTGKVVKLGDFDETAGAEPNYWIPHHTGAAENYDKCLIMSTKNVKLADAVLLKEPFSNRALTLGAGTSAMPVASIHPLSNYPAVEITNSGNVEQNQVNMLFTPSESDGGSAVMFYVKAPADVDTAIRFSWSWQNTRNPKMVTGAYNYSGQVYLMSKEGREWEMVNIDKYFVAIPAGFEGYLRINMAKIYCVYPYDENDNIIYKLDDDGNKVLNDAGNAYVVDPDADYYSLAKNPQEWGLNTVYFMWKGIPNGESAYVSVPILADNIDETTTSPWATFHDGEKFARDVFTGAVLKRTDIIKPTAVGDVLKKMPDATTEAKAKVSDKSKLANGKATVSWDAIDGASNYTVRVFLTQSGATGLVYKCVGVFDATDTSVMVTGLEPNKRYTAVVYAYDANGNEVAIFDYVQISTVGVVVDDGKKEDKKDNAVIGATTEEPAEDTGMNTIVLIAIIAGGVLLVAAAVIVVIILSKKRKAKKA